MRKYNSKLKNSLKNLIKDAFQEVFIENQLPDVQTSPAKNELIPKKTVAQMYGVSLVTIQKWVNKGILPNPIKLGGRVYFRETDLRNMEGQK